MTRQNDQQYRFLNQHNIKGYRPYFALNANYLIKHMYCQPHYLAGRNPCKCELGCSNNTAQGSTRWQENSNSSSQKAQQNHNDFQIYCVLSLRRIVVFCIGTAPNEKISCSSRRSGAVGGMCRMCDAGF